MSFSTKLRAMLGRTIRAVPDGHPGCLAVEDLPTFTYCPQSDLPPMLAAEAEPWRVDASGEQWYRLRTINEDSGDDFEDTDDDWEGDDYDDD